MGPQCPHCSAVYEWTCGELEEQVTAPKVYFCQECRGLFILSPDEVEALQERFRPALEEADRNEPVDEPSEGDDDDVQAQPQPSPVRAQASPIADDDDEPIVVRDRVRVVRGPHEGVVGAVAVIDDEQVTLRVEGRNFCVRVSVNQLRRAA